MALSTIANTVADDRLAQGIAGPSAFTDGFRSAFWVGAGVAFVGLLVSIFVVRSRDIAPVGAVEVAPATA